MSFRWRLFLCLALAVLVGTTVEIVVDFLETREQVTAAIAQALQETLDQAELAVSLDRPVPILRSETGGPQPGSGRFRAVRDGVTVFEAGGAFPAGDSFVYGSRELSEGYAVEAAVDPALYRQILYQRLRSDLLTDVAQVALSLTVAWLLAGWLLRPIGQLTQAVDALSQQRFPDPVRVPAGRDELARLARSFNRMTANLKAAFDRERTFTRYASHELRTPLSAIKLQVEAMQLGLADRDDVIPVLERNTDRIQRVLEALLSLARAAEHSAEPIALTMLAEETVRTLPEPLQARIEVVDRLSHAVFVSNPYLVGQAILNLLDNALKYTENGVTLMLEGEDDGLRITIRDRGPGVPDELIDKLTHTFFRLGSLVEGHGLGLAFVKHIIHTVGGKLELTNIPGGFEAALVLPPHSDAFQRPGAKPRSRTGA